RTTTFLLKKSYIDFHNREIVPVIFFIHPSVYLHVVVVLVSKKRLHFYFDTLSGVTAQQTHAKQDKEKYRNDLRFFILIISELYRVTRLYGLCKLARYF